MFRLRRRTASPGMILAIGCLIALIGVFWLGGTVRFVWRAERTMGMITEITKHAGPTHPTAHDGVSQDRTAKPFYRPIITFYDKSGNLRQVMEAVGSSPNRWQVNQAVGVLYAPDNPDNACIDSFLTVWAFPLLFVGMGGLFIVIGMVRAKARIA
jgi:hypothetical protein